MDTGIRVEVTAEEFDNICGLANASALSPSQVMVDGVVYWAEPKALVRRTVRLLVRGQGPAGELLSEETRLKLRRAYDLGDA